MIAQEMIVPIPQQLVFQDGPPTVLGMPGQANCYIWPSFAQLTGLQARAITVLQNKLRLLLKDEPAVITDPAMVVARSDTQDDGSAAQVAICLSISDPPDDMLNADQGYALTVTAAEVSVRGFGEAGLLYGVTTLIQCLKLEQNRLLLPCMDILDWPDLKTRGHFLESRYGSNLMTISDWKDAIDSMAAMKLNQLVISVYGCWCVQYDGRVSEYLYVPLRSCPKLKTPVVTRCFSPRTGGWIDKEQLPPMFAEDFLSDLIAYGRTCGVTVFPLFNSFGHNTLIPSVYPAVSALDEKGEPSLTGFCTANQQTYDLLFSIYDEIIDRYLRPNGIDSFHIGLDEVWDGIAQNAQDIYKNRSPWCQCPVCRTKSRKDIFIGHAIRLAKHLRKRGMKSIYMYHDMLIGHGRSIEEESCAAMMQALAENDLTDSVVIDWWTYSAHQSGLMFQSTRPELGLRRTVKPWNGYYHWTILTNALPNIRLLAEIGAREGVEGIQSYSSWDKSYDRNHLGLADFSWNFAGTGSIEHVNEHYARKHFASRFADALRGLNLLDLTVEDHRCQRQDGTPLPTHYDFVLHTLSYYFYSYVKADKPYPRYFPGEAIKKLLDNRQEYERVLQGIQAMAAQARQLFATISRDASCDQDMAARLAYEADNICCLTEDYLALLSMSDMAAAGKPDQYRLIQTLAGERKQARLDLMAQLEQVKEPCLQASHLRNHSIFMQYFADLEGYLTHNPDDKITLDFTDNTHFASPAFWTLR
ncbi:MAG: family 20 glycosylhydrolase [Bacillota bacterium]|nr:family 20 glycosylhydrolase [Bacillota bacterium]